MKRLNTVVNLLVFASLIAALYEQLRRPPEARTWHGRAFDFVPYDFRVPTVERLRNSFWNPGSSTILIDQPLGIGWTVNFAALYAWLRRQLPTTS